MGLKFQRDDSLDRKFDEFALLPEEKAKEEKKVDIQRFLEPEPKKKSQQTNKIHKARLDQEMI